MKPYSGSNPYIKNILEAATYAKQVTLNQDALRAYAEVLAGGDLPVPDWRAPVYPQADDDTFVQFLGVGNTINYCFTDVRTERKYAANYLGKTWTGAFGMWAALKRALDEGTPILDPQYLARISREEVERIFAGDPPLPMIEQRVQCLRSAGEYLRYQNYAQLFLSCGYRAFNSGEGIVEQLVKRDPCYSDTAYFQPTKQKLQFHKRANLFVLMYQGRALSSNGALPLIEDADNLTPPADYDVPKALRHLSILRYAPEFAFFVDNGISIPAKSRWEQEIRIQTVAAMYFLCKESGKPIVAVDFRVWTDGRQSLQPHHLTATTAY